MTDFFLLFGGTVSSLEKDGGAVFYLRKSQLLPHFCSQNKYSGLDGSAFRFFWHEGRARSPPHCGLKIWTRLAFEDLAVDDLQKNEVE